MNPIKIIADKECNRCGAMFNRRRRSTGRLESIAEFRRRKNCGPLCPGVLTDSEKSSNWKKRNPERAKQMAAKYYCTHRAERRAYWRAYYTKNSDRIKREQRLPGRVRARKESANLTYRYVKNLLRRKKPFRHVYVPPELIQATIWHIRVMRQIRR